MPVVSDAPTVVVLDAECDGRHVRGPLPAVTVLATRGRAAQHVCACVDVVLTDVPAPRPAVTVADVETAADEIRSAAARSPTAALTLVALLRQTRRLPVTSGLAAESAAYSMLLAGSEFRTWRAARPVRAVPPAASPVRLERADDILTVTLNRPERRNAFGVAIRDGLLDAFDLVGADPAIARVELRGAGPAFCSGGDLDEFGTATDVAAAHLVRLRASVAARVHTHREQVVAFVHGACIGAGVELPAFAARVVAAPDAFFALPEVAMGLVPGAGGTVSLPRRIGRRRTAYLALTGARLDPRRALDWGLVDAIGG